MSYKKASLLIAGTMSVILSACDLSTVSNPESTAFVGQFVDSRDNQVYKTALVGSQVWMAQNLNYASENSWCYEDDPAYCALNGRLYDWNAAMEVCPEGWHLPSYMEWEELWKSVGGPVFVSRKLKSSKFWLNGRNGDNPYGFSIVPSGYRDVGGGYHQFSFNAYLWGYRKKNKGPNVWNCSYSWSFRELQDNPLAHEEPNCTEKSFDEKTRLKGFAVRCIKD